MFMRFSRRMLFGAMLVTVAAVVRAEVRIHFEAGDPPDSTRIVVRGFDPQEWKRIAAASGAELQAALKVTYLPPSADEHDFPPLLGSLDVGDQRLLFTPRFPFSVAGSYRVEYRPMTDASTTWDTILQLPTTAGGASGNQVASTRVVAIYPSTARLPQNLLKFYIHFSAPMSQGSVYRQVEMTHRDGRPLHFPFLELAEELWDPSGTRLTLLLDPGRIKRGLVPREEDGAIFEIGQEYRLTVRQTWPDAQGNVLQQAAHKDFTIIEEDFVQPDPEAWEITVTKDQRIDVRFPEPLDHSLLSRALSIRSPAGKTVSGTIHISDMEKKWEFVPAGSLTAGTYTLFVLPVLEDLCGNSVERPFEVDLKAKALPKAPVTQRRFLIP